MNSQTTRESLSARPPQAEARRYAVKELARRAGVSREFFETWKTETTPQRTSISLGQDGLKRIHFDHTPEDVVERTARGEFSIARAGWGDLPAGETPETDLIVPFCESKADSSAPLFHRLNADEVLCRLDLPFSLLLTLGRAEESLPAQRDEHGRFPAAQSLAARHNFLERPIVDEWGLALEMRLRALLPSWQPLPRELRAKLTHDIDQVGIPFNFRSSAGHSIVRRKPLATLRDLAAPIIGLEPFELTLVRQLAAISRERGLHSAFFWKASERGPRDSGYDPSLPKIQSVIHQLTNDGFEMGVHPGYETFGSRERLSGEVERLRRALGVKSPGGRQHYLRWTPQTWLDWEACGLNYDSTVGFADRIGFRSGTSYPYRPWSLSENRELNLLEIPLILMDCTPVKYMGLPREEGLQHIRACVRRTARVGGVFTLLWHNLSLMEPEYDGWYEATLDLLDAGRRFEIPRSGASYW